MRPITLYLNEADLKAIDNFIAVELYPNRAEFMRQAIREKIQATQNYLLREAKWRETAHV
jgi:metal-responsive CopG/Arc/MetJ family transcriptional regulator